MKDKEYTCAVCGETFVGTQSEEDAEAEMKGIFGNNFKKEDCGVVCDDCWKKMGYGT